MNLLTLSNAKRMFPKVFHFFHRFFHIACTSRGKVQRLPNLHVKENNSGGFAKI